MATKIAAILGWLGTALVVVALGLWYVKPEWEEYRRYIAWAGLATILVYLVAQWRESQQGHNARQAKLGALSVVSIAAVLALLAGLNYLGVRQNKRWDLTANQVFSLSEQTLKVLQGLDSPAKLTVFDQAAQFDRFRDRLEEYTYQSKQLSVDYVDIDRQPARAKAANVQTAGTMVLEYKGRVERITTLEEQDIANAFIKATTGQERKVYFTAGHGEKDPTNSERTGYSAVAQSLTSDNYVSEKLVLAQSPTVPDGATTGDRRRPAHRFLPAGGRRARDLSGQGRQAPGDARSAREAGRAAAHQPHRAGERMGHPGRRRHRRRCLGRGPDVRRRRLGAGRGQLPHPPDHRSLQSDDGVPAGPVDCRASGRRQRPHRSGVRRDQRAELGGEGLWGA